MSIFRLCSEGFSYMRALSQQCLPQAGNPNQTTDSNDNPFVESQDNVGQLHDQILRRSLCFPVPTNLDDLWKEIRMLNSSSDDCSRKKVQIEFHAEQLMSIDNSPIVKILAGKSDDVHLDQLSIDEKEELFIQCAHYGQLDYLNELKKIFNSNAYNNAFKMAAENGHIDVLDFLFKSEKLTIFEDKEIVDRSGFNNLLYVVFRGGRLDVLNWIEDTFKLTTKDLKANNNQLFRNAVCVGSLDIVRYLVEERLELTKEDVLKIDNYAFEAAVSYNDIEVVKYLVTFLGLTKEDVQANDNRAFKAAVQYGK